MNTRWGRWILDVEGQSLCLMDEESLMCCCVPLHMCNTSAEILDWISQIQHKTRIRPLDLGNLVEALDDLLDLQRNFCGAGIERAPYHPETRFVEYRLDMFDHKSGKETIPLQPRGFIF